METTIILKGAWIERDLEPGIRCADERNGKELDKFALNGGHSRFRATLSPQLLVDVVKGIAQGLEGSTTSAPSKMKWAFCCVHRYAHPISQ